MKEKRKHPRCREEAVPAFMRVADCLVSFRPPPQGPRQDCGLSETSSIFVFRGTEMLGSDYLIKESE